MAETPYVSVKNWDRFQQYRDGRPIHWLKLHLSLLRDYEFSRLPDTAKAHLMLIWILAAETGNKIPADPAWIQARIQASEPVDLTSLVNAGFVTIYGESSSFRASAETVSPQTGVSNADCTNAVTLDFPMTSEDTVRFRTDSDDIVAQSKSKSKSKKKKQNNREGELALTPAVSILEYWKRLSGHPNAFATNDRIAKINLRLKTFTPEQLRLALDKAAKDEWLRGKNDRGRDFFRIETVFKSDAKVAEYLEAEPEPDLWAGERIVM